MSGIRWLGIGTGGGGGGLFLGSGFLLANGLGGLAAAAPVDLVEPVSPATPSATVALVEFDTLNLEGRTTSSLDFRHKSNVLNSLISSSSASDLFDGIII